MSHVEIDLDEIPYERKENLLPLEFWDGREGKSKSNWVELSLWL